MEMSLIERWLRKIGASFFFIGYLPASGTACSAVVAALLWLVNTHSHLLHVPGEPMFYWLACIVVTAISCFLASGSTVLFGKEDSGKIVIDEVAGQLITFLFVPITVRTLIAGFFLFRFYDIVKPYPVYCMEELDDGLGVTMDDAAAGVYANVSLLIVLMAYHAIKAHL
jgi:phosphatidylglycerophosphatase A